MIVSAKVIGDGITYAVYSRQGESVNRGHKDFVMSRSEIVNCAFNPKRWLDGYQEDKGDTDATRWGNLIECLAGLNGDYAQRYSVAPTAYPDAKTGELKAWNWNATFCKEWRQEQGEREVIKSDLQLKAEVAHQALCADDDVCQLFTHSRKQVMVTGFWEDKATGIEIPIRCLIDLVPDRTHPNPLIRKALGDFKTARNGCPDIWARVVDDSGYDVQAALSLDLYTKATGEDRTDWIMPTQENVHPYHVVKPMPALTVEFISYGRAKYESALNLYAQYLTLNHWPSYSTGTRLILGPMQFIGPDGLWKYRESGGAVASRMEYEPEPPRKKQEESQDVPH